MSGPWDGRLRRGRLAWALGAASCEQRASRPRRLPARPRHGSGVGQNLDLPLVPKASGILQPLPQFPASCPTRPWPSHQGPAALRSVPRAWSLESQKPVPRPCLLCWPRGTAPQGGTARAEEERVSHSVIPSLGSRFKISLRVWGAKGVLSQEPLSDAVWSLGTGAFFTAVKK